MNFLEFILLLGLAEGLLFFTIVTLTHLQVFEGYVRSLSAIWLYTLFFSLGLFVYYIYSGYALPAYVGSNVVIV